MDWQEVYWTFPVEKGAIAMKVAVSEDSLSWIFFSIIILGSNHTWWCSCLYTQSWKCLGNVKDSGYWTQANCIYGKCHTHYTIVSYYSNFNNDWNSALGMIYIYVEEYIFPLLSAKATETFRHLFFEAIHTKETFLYLSTMVTEMLVAGFQSSNEPSITSVTFSMSPISLLAPTSHLPLG